MEIIIALVVVVGVGLYLRACFSAYNNPLNRIDKFL
jgi:hypothetical protein